MKKTRIFVSMLLVLLLVTACGSPKIYTDYDETKDFTTYHDFAFYTDIESGLDTLDQVRLQKALVKSLEAKSLSKSEDPDFLVNFYADFTEEANRNNLGISIGTIGSHVGGNIASGIPIMSRRKIMTITVELVDVDNNALFWQGAAEVRLKKNPTPEKRTQLFTTIAEKILSDYPPK